ATANKTKCVRAPPNDDDDASTPSMMTRQFQTLRHLLADFSPAPKTMARRTARCKTFPDDHTISALTPLSSSTIRWLPKPPHGPLHVPVTGCLYYCIDEYAASKLRHEPQSRLDNPATSLGIVASNEANDAAMAKSHRLAQAHEADMTLAALHEDDDDTLAFHVVHVPKDKDHVVHATRQRDSPSASSPPLRFAPANVSHLIQTAACHALVDGLPEDHRLHVHSRYPRETFGAVATLGHLYVAVPRHPSVAGQHHPLLTSALRPVGVDAMRVLVATYLVRDPTVTEPSACFALYRPTMGSDPTTAYCVVENPSFLLPPSSTVDVPALLVQYVTTPQGASHELTTPTDHVSILGSFCRWRSCLDLATPSASSLCPSHHRVEKQLNPDERQQFVGRDASVKAGAAPAMEIRHIKQSSSLLEELLNKQLGTTLSSFLDKVQLDGSNPSLAAKFLAPTNKDAADQLADEKRMLESILQVEQDVTDEVNALVALGVYPTAELGLLRQKDAASMTALQASQRKVKLFRTRRQEEEEKLQQHPPKSLRKLLLPSKSCPNVTKGLGKPRKLRRDAKG
ncbi:hypothetical protein As57867_001411, partial [Aphanomyces stellatus]